MCWNSQVSLNTFVFGVFGLWLSWFNGYSPFLLLFLFSFIVMQFIEFGIWKSIYANDDYGNMLFSTLGFVVVFLQPVASILMLYTTDRLLMYTFLLLYCGIAFGIILASSSKYVPDLFRSSAGDNGHLAWNWGKKQNSSTLFIVVHAMFLLVPLFLTKHYILFATAATTLVISLVFFYKYDTWGSMWCWIANIIVFALVFKILILDVTVGCSRF